MPFQKWYIIAMNAEMHIAMLVTRYGSLRQASLVTGIPLATLHRAVNGSRVTDRTARRLAVALGLKNWAQLCKE